ncbi:MAG: flippase [Rhodococcus sp. (in: high G+C Gram-positive bacteria)]
MKSLSKGGAGSNASLLLLDSVVRMGATLVIGVIVARVYGPDGFGAINTAISLCTIVLGFSALGMSGILVKELIERPGFRGTIMTTVVVAKSALGGMLYLSMLMFLNLFGDSNLTVVVAIIGFGYLFTSLDVFEANFNADSDFKRLVFLHIGGVVLATVVKLIVLVVGGSLSWLAIGYGLDYAFMYLLPALYFFIKTRPAMIEGVSYRAQFLFPELVSLLKRSWPIMASGFLAQVNLRIDALMIAALLSFSQVGIYTAAGRLSESWTVLAMAIVTAVFPMLVRSSKTDREQYADGLLRLFRLLVWISLAGATVVFFLSPMIIRLLYGVDFAASATVLSIHIFGGMFLFVRTALSRWLIVENLYIFSLLSHGAGAIVNIIGNALVLDRFGVVGAAWVAVLSYATSGLFFLLLTPRTRVLFKIIIVSSIPGRHRAPQVRKLVDKLPSAKA